MNTKKYSSNKKPGILILPKSLTTVTKLSKLLALSLFIILPVTAFYFGLQYGLDASTTQSNPETNSALQACTSKYKAAVTGTVLHLNSSNELHTAQEQKIFIPKLKNKELTANTYWYKGILISQWNYIDPDTNIEYRIWHNKLEDEYEETYGVTREDYFQIRDKIETIYYITDSTVTSILDEIKLAESEIKTENQDVFYEIPTYTALGITEVKLVSLISPGIGLGSIYVELTKPIEDYVINKSDPQYKKILAELIAEAQTVTAKE